MLKTVIQLWEILLSAESLLTLTLNISEINYKVELFNKSLKLGLIFRYIFLKYTRTIRDP